MFGNAECFLTSGGGGGSRHGQVLLCNFVVFQILEKGQDPFGQEARRRLWTVAGQKHE